MIKQAATYMEGALESMMHVTYFYLEEKSHTIYNGVINTDWQFIAWDHNDDKDKSSDWKPIVIDVVEKVRGF